MLLERLGMDLIGKLMYVLIKIIQAKLNFCKLRAIYVNNPNWDNRLTH